MPQSNSELPIEIVEQAPERIVILAAIQFSAGADDGDPLEPALALTLRAAAAGAVEESGRAVEGFSALGRETGLLVALNVVEAGDDGRHYNSVCLVDGTGVTGTYRQVHLRRGDRAWATPGDGFPVFDTPLGKL